MQSIDRCAFRLARTGDPAAAQAIIDEIGAQAVQVLPFTAIELSRFGQPGLTDAAADRLEGLEPYGFRWDEPDMRTRAWYPQGMSGSDDAWDTSDRRLFAVSWYDKDPSAPAKGVRISLIDATDPADVRYEHVLLVEPLRRDGRATFNAVRTENRTSLHAGGIVWYGDLLYVADTQRGLRVFDLRQAIEVDSRSDKSRIGVSADRMDAFGYRYIVPQIDRYETPDDACWVRYSFAGLDRSHTPPLIATGEYRRSDVKGRVVRWPLGDDGWLMPDADGRVTAYDAVAAAQSQMQGALSWQGDWYISSSYQIDNLGLLYRNQPGGQSSSAPWLIGCEDLYFERHTGLIWTPAEFPNIRDIVAIPLSQAQ